MKCSCREGEFKVLRPAKSMKGYWIVGAVVGSDKKGMTYTVRVPFKKDCLNEIMRLRDRIFKDHPGIKEIFGDQ